MLRYYDFCDKDLLKSTAIQELRKLGYKNVQKLRKSGQKSDQDRHLTCESKLFHNELHLLPRKIETSESGVSLEIPTFVVEACECIEKNVSTEGIFRKAGSSARQREIKALLEDGKALASDHHVIDVANILKLFFRELPEPLIPFNCHDILIWCLQMKEKAIDCLLLTCLVLPSHHLDTLLYFMQFLQRIADHADTNKMDVNNLSIIMAPTLMPVEEKKSENMSQNGTRLKNHVKVVELFIKNSRVLGDLPKWFEKKLPVPAQNMRSCVRRRDDGNKKKRRSGSLTRVLSGLRRMVGKAPSPCNGTLTKTQSSHSFGKKRKALESSSSFNRKKKHDEFRSYLPKESNLCYPQDTLMPCNASGLCPSPQVCYNPNVSPELVKNKSCECEIERKRLMTGYPSMDTIQDLEEDKITSKLKSRGSKVQLNPVRRWSSMTTTRENKTKSTSDKNSFPSRISELERLNDAGVNNPCCRSKVEEKRPQSEQAKQSSGSNIMANLEEEYEKIKSKVSAIENQLMEEFGRLGATVEGTMCTAPPIANEDMEVLETVQTKYEKALEESERISDSSADHLAKRLSRELKIRRSAEHKIIRSPSARKIGSLRRRSRDSCKQQKLSFNMDDSSKGATETIPSVQTLNQEQLNVSNNSGNELYFQSSLKRGRPNTVRSGLKQPSPVPQIDLECDPSRIHLTFLNKIPAQGKQGISEHKETPNTKSQSLMELSSSVANRQTATEISSLPAAWESKLKQIQNFDFATPDVLKLKSANHLTYTMSTPMTPVHLRRASSFQDTAESSGTKYNLNNQGDIKKCISSVNVSHEKTNDRIEKVSSQSNSMHWHSAASFLSDQNLSEQPVSGRESIAKLRAQNAGKVLANVKLFEHNGINQDVKDANCGNSHPNIRENLRHRSIEHFSPRQNVTDQISHANMLELRRSSHSDKPTSSFSDSESPHNRQRHFRKRGRLSAPSPGKQRYYNCSSPAGQKKPSPLQWLEQSKENLIKSPEILVDDLAKNHRKDLFLDNINCHGDKMHNSHISPLKENNRILVLRKDSPNCNFHIENDNPSRNMKGQNTYTPSSPIIKHPLTCEHSSLRPISRTKKKRPSPMRAIHSMYPDGTPKKSPRRQSPRLLLRSRLMSNSCM